MLFRIQPNSDRIRGNTVRKNQKTKQTLFTVVLCSVFFKVINLRYKSYTNFNKFLLLL